MHTYVPGIGPSNAKIALIGEAPEEREEESGIPFSGPSGAIVDECLYEAGIQRNSVYLSNVVKIRPPFNKIKDLHLIGRSIDEFIPQLTEELAKLKPNVVIAVGDTALKALTGHVGIKNYRGSMLRSILGPFKVIPTIHPASLMHGEGEGMSSWQDLYYIKHDFKRAERESHFPDLRLPNRTLEIARSSSQVYRFLNTYNGKNEVAVDVETSKTVPVCVGLAFNNWHALSIPTLTSTIPRSDLVYIWKILAEFFGDKKLKFIAQNGKFDEKRCREMGLRWHDFYFDVMFGWSTLYPELPKRLAFITSIITDEPYYKDEGGDYDPKKHDFDRLLSYNAKDAVVEFECYEKILSYLRDEKLEDFFFDKIMPLHRLYSDIEDVGLLVDQKVRARLREKYEVKLKEKHEKLVNWIIDGDENLRETFKSINVNSPKQIASLLYGYLRCPPRKDVKEDTLKSLANNNLKDQRRRDIVQSILEGRKISKTIGTYIDANLSVDGRIRTECMVCGTESGRTSTQVRKPPVVVTQEGLALQTMTKHEDVTLDAGGADLRGMFIADEGWTFIEPDLSQAEDRVVGVLSTDWDALKDYERKEYKRNAHGLKDDRHTRTAMAVTGQRFEDVRDYDRQIGKRVRHAGNYNMGKHQGMLTLAKYGIFISEWRMGKYLDEFHAANPKIRGVFHQGIQEALRDNSCKLRSPHGRVRQFFNKWGDELFKEAYAQIPQATVSDQTKFAMLEIKKEIGKLNILFLLESHDSFLALVRDDDVSRIAPIIKKHLEKPINFSGCTLKRDFELIIPCEIKTGKRWIEKCPEFPDGMEKLTA